MDEESSGEMITPGEQPDQTVINHKRVQFWAWLLSAALVVFTTVIGLTWRAAAAVNERNATLDQHTEEIKRVTSEIQHLRRDLDWMKRSQYLISFKLGVHLPAQSTNEEEGP